jgi:hypothetical protein
MLPVSICVHVLAGIACLIVPLAAVDEWPTPAPLGSLVVAMKAVPVAASVTPPASRHAPAVSVIAPAEIGPERDVHVEPVGPIVTGVPLDGAIGLADAGYALELVVTRSEERRVGK